MCFLTYLLHVFLFILYNPVQFIQLTLKLGLILKYLYPLFSQIDTTEGLSLISLNER